MILFNESYDFVFSWDVESPRGDCFFQRTLRNHENISLRDHRRYVLWIIEIFFMRLYIDWGGPVKISVVAFDLQRRSIHLFDTVWLHDRIHILLILGIQYRNWSYDISLNSGALNSLNIFFRSFFIFQTLAFQSSFITLYLLLWQI